MKQFLLVRYVVAALASFIFAGSSGAGAELLPDWIWCDSSEPNGTSVEFYQHFEAPEAVNEARLRFAADFARCSITLNGDRVGGVDDFGPLVDIDVAQFLKRGRNSICIVAIGSAGPSSVVLSLETVGRESSEVCVLTDSSWQCRPNGAVEGRTVSRGTVSPQYWLRRERGEVTSFDDYEQWKQAETINDEAARHARITAMPGFEIDLVRKAQPDEGSWVSMAFDAQDRITIAREDQGLLRLTLGDGESQETMETINEGLKECRGLLYAHGSLYANANNSKGLYRLTDTNGDDQFDNVKLLREFSGGVGHGRNDLALGPDGMIYSIHGDSVDLPHSDTTDLTSPFRDGRLEQPHGQGHLLRTDKDGNRWELVSTGLRNPFGIDFNKYGDVFTYDADAEFDMGAPWYRPTRLNHLTAGADFGWRSLTRKWPPYELDHADNALPTATIGKGSPTAVRFGSPSHFPAPWRESLFVLDWAYGRILACHLFPRGGGYVCRSETFLQGRPLNVTDLDFGADGAMYFVVGGRKTESAVYRVRWAGTPVVEDPRSVHATARDAWSARKREQRREIESLRFSQDTDKAVEVAWPGLASPDPSIRNAARVALESQPLDMWRRRAMQETDPSTAAVALLSVARATREGDCVQVLTALNRLPVKDLSALDSLSVLQAYSLSFEGASVIKEALRKETINRLDDWLSHEVLTSPGAKPPVGAGRSVVAKLCRVIMSLSPTSAHNVVVGRLREATTQSDRMLYLYLLRDTTTGWSDGDRHMFFEILNDVARTALGGDGMPGFLKNIREAAKASLTDRERALLGDLVEPPKSDNAPRFAVKRPFVRKWTINDLDELLSSPVGDRTGGHELFRAALCVQCHRLGHRGGLVGPDLTSVGRRFGERDLLKSILAPSDVVSEKYRNSTIVTRGGKTVTGRVLLSGDYRSTTLRISVDPLDASKVVDVAKSEVEHHKASMISPMPEGLLSTLTAAEICQLVTYLSTGNAGNSR